MIAHIIISCLGTAITVLVIRIIKDRKRGE